MIVYGIRVPFSKLTSCAWAVNHLRNAIPIPETFEFEPSDVINYIVDELQHLGITVFEEFGYAIIGATFSLMGNEETRKQFTQRVDQMLSTVLGEEFVSNSDHITLHED